MGRAVRKNKDYVIGSAFEVMGQVGQITSFLYAGYLMFGHESITHHPIYEIFAVPIVMGVSSFLYILGNTVRTTSMYRETLEQALSSSLERKIDGLY